LKIKPSKSFAAYPYCLDLGKGQSRVAREVFDMKNPKPESWFVVILFLACVAAVVLRYVLNAMSN
jgi:hypothetical protein